MRQDDWRPIDTAPLNPYGKAWGPIVLVWCTANEQPVAAWFDPQGSINDNGPRWCTGDNAEEIGIEDVSHWVPIAPPRGKRLIGEDVTDAEGAP